MSYIKYLLAEFKAPLNPPHPSDQLPVRGKKKKKGRVYKESICLFVWFSDKQTYRYTNVQLEIFFSLQGYMTFAHNLLLVWACSSAVIPWVQIAKIKRELFFLKFFEPV